MHTLSRIQFHVNGNSFKYNEAHRAQCFQQRMTHFTHFSPQNQPNRLQIVSKKMFKNASRLGLRRDLLSKYVLFIRP
jgi:hypothetical protein